MTARTAQAINRVIDGVVRAMMIIPQAALFAAMVLTLVMATQALPWIFPALFG